MAAIHKQMQNKNIPVLRNAVYQIKGIPRKELSSIFKGLLYMWSNACGCILQNLRWRPSKLTKKLKKSSKTVHSS